MSIDPHESSSSSSPKFASIGDPKFVSIGAPKFVDVPVYVKKNKKLIGDYHDQLENHEGLSLSHTHQYPHHHSFDETHFSPASSSSHDINGHLNQRSWKQTT
jgi:hypothetical protein